MSPTGPLSDHWEHQKYQHTGSTSCQHQQGIQVIASLGPEELRSSNFFSPHSRKSKELFCVGRALSSSWGEHRHHHGHYRLLCAQHCPHQEGMVFLQLQALDQQRVMLSYLCLMVRSLVDPLQHLARTSERQAGAVRSRPPHLPVDTRLPHWPPTVCEHTGCVPVSAVWGPHRELCWHYSSSLYTLQTSPSNLHTAISKTSLMTAMVGLITGEYRQWTGAPEPPLDNNGENQEAGGRFLQAHHPY